MRKPGHQGNSRCSPELSALWTWAPTTMPPRPIAVIPRKTRRPTAILVPALWSGSSCSVVVTPHDLSFGKHDRGGRRRRGLPPPAGSKACLGYLPRLRAALGRLLEDVRCLQSFGRCLEALGEANGHHVACALFDGALQVRFDRQLVCAVPERHEGTLE